ncbi:MAG: TlpA disulfide reductase family protein [Ilumatobacter sp.]|uniref:TlpA family protein disulfide reductase n=1 Tax=Ilumatobacter sp. TaxID=1967498 RepID=UPI0032978B82
MKINRPRLLVGSLAVAVIVSVAGGYVWSQTVGGDDASDVDAVLDDPQDRTIPDAVSEIPTNDAVEGEMLPEAVVLDPDGNEVSTQSFLGQPTVINFWYSTCVPCAKELPDFAEVHAEVGSDVRFIGINTTDSVPVMERFAADKGVTYDLYQDSFAEFFEGVGIAAFPQTLFVTSDGLIVEQTGVIDADGLRAEVAELQEVDNR